MNLINRNSIKSVPVVAYTDPGHGREMIVELKFINAGPTRYGRDVATTSRFGILREEGNRAGINANRRLDSRRACPFIPAGLSLYSRRALPSFPQGCPFIPAGLARAPRACSSFPACADGPGPGPSSPVTGSGTLVPRCPRPRSALEIDRAPCQRHRPVKWHP